MSEPHPPPRRRTPAPPPMGPPASLGTEPNAEGGLLRGLIHSIPTPLLVLDRSARVVTFNEGFVHYLGPRRQPRRGDSLTEWATPAEADVLQDALFTTLSGFPLSEEPLATLSDSPDIHRLSTARLEPNGVPMVLFILRGTREAPSEASDDDELKRFLFQALAHDLRTPLGGIMNGLECLGSLVDETTSKSAEARKLLQLVSRCAEQISWLVTDLTDYFQIHTEEGVPATTSLDLRELVESLLDVYRLQGIHHGFRLTVDGDVQVDGNPELIRRVLDNLISNAVKYSPEAGLVTVRLDGTRPDEPVVVEVTDRGVGIPRESLGEIWNPLKRLRDPACKKVPGSGLGLPIVRHLVQRWGGSIDVKSTPGEGSSFRFTVPRRR